MSTFKPDRDYLALARVVEVNAKMIRQGPMTSSYTETCRHMMIAVAKMVAQTPDDREETPE